MSTEFFFFVITAAVAIAAAFFMLWTDNAVHNALFLIINFACVAFLYLMLEAPFLAMIQIAVYVGAIMVLFLFVIMLLGAEKTVSSQRKFRWFTPVALFLSVSFLLAVGLALIGGQIEALQPTNTPALLRLINAAPDATEMDVYANNERIAEGLAFRDATSFVRLPSGDYTLTFVPTGLGPESALITQAVTLAPGDAKTSVVYGESLLPMTTLIDDNLNASDYSRTANVTIFNGYTGEAKATLVDTGLDGILQAKDADNNDDKVIGDVALGEMTVIQRTPGTSPLAFVREDGTPLFQVRDFKIERENSQMVILTGERLFDESLRPLAIPLTSKALPSFGGPESVGQLLYTRYLLPFEMVAVLLLISMIGAIVLTHREDEPVRRRQNIRRKVSRPLTSVIAAQVGHEIDAKQLPSEVSDEQPEPAGD